MLLIRPWKDLIDVWLTLNGVRYFPTLVYNLPIILSDHAPILLSTDAHMRKPRRNFKFENWWLMENDFHEYAKNVWIASRNKAFHNRKTNLAGSLRTWCGKKKPIQ